MSDPDGGSDTKTYHHQITEDEKKEDPETDAVGRVATHQEQMHEGRETQSQEDALAGGRPQVAATNRGTAFAHDILSHVIEEAVRRSGITRDDSAAPGGSLSETAARACEGAGGTAAPPSVSEILRHPPEPLRDESIPLPSSDSAISPAPEEPEAKAFLSTDENEFQRPDAGRCLDSIGSLEELSSGPKEILILSSRQATGSTRNVQVGDGIKESDTDSGLETDSFNSQVSSYEKISRTSTEKNKTEAFADSSERNTETEETGKDLSYTSTLLEGENLDEVNNAIGDETAKENVSESRRECAQSSSSVAAIECKNSEEGDLDSNAKQETETSVPATISTTPERSPEGLRDYSEHRDSFLAEQPRETQSNEKQCVSAEKDFSKRTVTEGGKEYDHFWSSVGLLRNYKDSMRPPREAEAESVDEGGSSDLARNDDDEVKAAMDVIFPGEELEDGKDDDDDTETDDEPVTFVALQRDEEERENKGEGKIEETEASPAFETTTVGDDARSFKCVPALHVPEAAEPKKSLARRMRGLFKTLTTMKKKKRVNEFDTS